MIVIGGVTLEVLGYLPSGGDFQGCWGTSGDVAPGGYGLTAHSEAAFGILAPGTQ